MYLFPFNWHVLFDFHVFLQKHQKNRNTCPHSSYEGYSFNNCINELHILCPVRFDTKLEVIQNTLLAQGLFKEKNLSKLFLHKSQPNVKNELIFKKSIWCKIIFNLAIINLCFRFKKHFMSHKPNFKYHLFSKNVFIVYKHISQQWSGRVCLFSLTNILMDSSCSSCYVFKKVYGMLLRKNFWQLVSNTFAW